MFFQNRFLKLCNLIYIQNMSNTFDHNNKTYFIHPTFQNYGASADGYIINRKRLEPRKGYLSPNGYYIISPGRYNTCQAHRMVWEAVNQSIIPPGLQINHINCDRQDNSSKNLELVTASENIKKMHQSRKAFFNSSYNEDELRVVNTLMAFPIEDDDCEFTKTENKIINKMYYRMCHHLDDTDFPLYRD